MTDVTRYTALNRRGEVCTPHRYADGRFRAVRYVPGTRHWKAKENYIVVPEAELPLVMADPGLAVRMSPMNAPDRPSLFRTGSVTRGAAPPVLHQPV